MVEANGVQLCTEPFGDPADPPILLITGIGGSMLWWEEDFCRMLADDRRFVIRYDHRDTGRSVTYEPGRPGYSGSDMVADAAGVLDAGRRSFDEGAFRELARREVERAHNIAAVENHDAMPDDERPRDHLSSIAAPTLVIHGTADPMFPFEHGEALAREIPGARLLPLDGAGHGVYRTDWETIARAIVVHTDSTPPGGG